MLKRISVGYALGVTGVPFRNRHVLPRDETNKRARILPLATTIDVCYPDDARASTAS